jgi:hypothetical protein
VITSKSLKKGSLKKGQRRTTTAHTPTANFAIFNNSGTIGGTAYILGGRAWPVPKHRHDWSAKHEKLVGRCSGTGVRR